MELSVVYDFVNESFRFENVLMPLLLVLAGCVFLFTNKFSKMFSVIFVVSASIFCMILIPQQVKNYYNTKAIYENSEYKVVEGVVTNFDPMPHSGHKNESFTIKGVKFEYSDFDESYYGFNNTKSHGGPVNEGRKFKVSYFTSKTKNIILKIEVFK
jgi:hypothetical protein